MLAAAHISVLWLYGTVCLRTGHECILLAIAQDLLESVSHYDTFRGVSVGL